ncbi:MAG TPA: DUF3108 domain-containing protein [Gemmatimonadales bacterium]|nr:DUF3108 domain-containing protein [Gemmatimonadales bacterium]
MPAATLLAHAALIAQLSAPYPFAVGETLQYEASLGYFPVGTASATVARTTRERGTDALVFTAVGEGGPPGFRARYEMTSWVQSARLASLRFHRRLTQGSKVEEERYQIVPDSGRYRQEGVARDWVTPRDPLDELAYLYYLRTIPLEVGKSFTMSRYFKTGYNPVHVRVTGREPVALFDGRTVPCFTVELTSRGATMGVSLTDDARRLPVALSLPLPYGTVTLALTAAGQRP